jgi:hypothetical protein
MLQFLKTELLTGNQKVQQHRCWLTTTYAIPSTDIIRRPNLIFSMKDSDVAPAVPHGQKRSRDQENGAGGSDHDIHAAKKKRFE